MQEHKYSIKSENFEYTILDFFQSTNQGHNFYFSNPKLLDKGVEFRKKMNSKQQKLK